MLHFHPTQALGETSISQFCHHRPMLWLALQHQHNFLSTKVLELSLNGSKHAVDFGYEGTHRWRSGCSCGSSFTEYKYVQATEPKAILLICFLLLTSVNVEVSGKESFESLAVWDNLGRSLPFVHTL